MDVRTRILDAALGLLAKGGAQELTQPRISRAAGVRQSHLTYYFPTINDLLQAVAKHSIDALVAELGSRDLAQQPASLAGGVADASADKRRVRVMLGLVMAADREPALKPRLRTFIAELRRGFAPILRAAGLEGTPAQIAFMHSVVIGQAVLQLARDNNEARREAHEVLGMAIDFLRLKG
ncbi:MAG: TetR family transcriptional regulator [Burkholderiales bacterium]|nr:TetR family transcriptional regulator [Burkholderiales bacterium]